MLKGASKTSLWLRNIQLATYSTAIACVGLVGQRGVAALSPSTLLAGFDQPDLWLSVLWQSAGEILVAVTIKYADNILRGFAQGVAIIVGAIGSHYIFGFELSAVFIVGVGAVLVAVFLYGGPPHLCPSLCGWCCAPVVARRRRRRRPERRRVAAGEYVGGGDRRRAATRPAGRR